MSFTTQPVQVFDKQTAPTIVVPAFHKDPATGQAWVHRDLVQVQEAYAEEDHIGPVKAHEHFGDVESWTAYVLRFAHVGDYAPLLTWNAKGLRAVLDYHTSEDAAGRCQWTATYPFVLSREWEAWKGITHGQPIPQRTVIERLEDLADNIASPTPADLMALLRTLRATVNAKADAELRPDGTTSVSFAKDATVRGGTAGEAVLPSEFAILIPVLKGHVDQKGAPVLYRLPVRVRVSVSDDARLGLRLSMPTAERTLDAALLDQVEAARSELGETLPILRAAD